MSTIAISYYNLETGAKNCCDVSNKIRDYADSIQNKVYNKLNNYTGEYTENISSASECASNKINELRDKYEKFNNLGNKLKDTLSQCRSVDKDVASRLSQMGSEFKQNNGISDTVLDSILDMLDYALVNVLNSSSIARMIDHIINDTFNDYATLFSAISDWYNYEGGKAFIKGIADTCCRIAKIVCEFVVAVIAIACAACPFVAVIILITAAIVIAVDIMDAVTNAVNESTAYKYAQDGDPATAQRWSDRNTYTDTIRKTSDSKKLHNACNIIDITYTGAKIVNSIASMDSNPTENLDTVTTIASTIADFADNGSSYFQQNPLTPNQDFNNFKKMLIDDAMGIGQNKAVDAISDKNKIGGKIIDVIWSNTDTLFGINDATFDGAMNVNNLPTSVASIFMPPLGTALSGVNVAQNIISEYNGSPKDYVNNNIYNTYKDIQMRSVQHKTFDTRSYNISRQLNVFSKDYKNYKSKMSVAI